MAMQRKITSMFKRKREQDEEEREETVDVGMVALAHNVNEAGRLLCCCAVTSLTLAVSYGS